MIKIKHEAISMQSSESDKTRQDPDSAGKYRTLIY